MHRRKEGRKEGEGERGREGKRSKSVPDAGKGFDAPVNLTSPDLPHLLVSATATPGGAGDRFFDYLCVVCVSIFPA